MFLVTVRGNAERTLLVAMEDLADRWVPDEYRSTLTTEALDQAEMVALLCGLHELGIPIERVVRVRPLGGP